jgi:oligopeptide/dipeptide ABC transporter ATP-binding protein
MNTVIEVENLVKHFPVHGSRAVVQAVNGVTFSIQKGETLSIVGESGSGKTTVGRCILGLITPTSGNIRFFGRKMGPAWNVRSRNLRGKMQLVFQEPGESLDPLIPVWRSVEEPLQSTIHSRLDREKKVRSVIDLVNLPISVLHQYPMELSAGQQQRVAIARAIVTDPELLVLDEPTSALSPTERAEIIDLLIRIQQELSTAYLFISHDLSTVHHISHRIAVMYLGRIIEEGDSREVFRTPHHPYSVGLLSSVLLPSPNLRRETTFVLEGETPSPINLPPGCPLVSRCPFRIDRCAREFPAPEAVTAAHRVHCFRHTEVAAKEQATDTFQLFQTIAEEILSVPVRSDDQITHSLHH